MALMAHVDVERRPNEDDVEWGDGKRCSSWRMHYHYYFSSVSHNCGRNKQARRWTKLLWQRHCAV